MEVRALVAIVQNPQQIVQQHIKNHYNMISQSPTQANFQRRPFSPLMCTHGCGCYDSYQRVGTANHDRMRPTMQPIQQQPLCCGSGDCICRRNNLLIYDKVNRGTDMSMMILDSERIARDQTNAFNNKVHHFHHIDLTSSGNKEQLFTREQVGSRSVSSINEELVPMKNTQDIHEPVYVYQQQLQHQNALQMSVHETDGERQLTNPLNQFEEYVKNNQSAVGQMYINSKMNQLQSSIQDGGQEIWKNGFQPIQNKTNLPMTSQNIRKTAAIFSNQKQEYNLMVGGTHIDHKTVSAGGQVSASMNQKMIPVGNPQIQIVKTICSTKNSFLPNFKMKKREYQFGEHKLNKIQDAQMIHQNQSLEPRPKSNGRVVLRNGTPYSQNEAGRMFSLVSGSANGSNSPKGRRGSTNNQQQQAEEVKQIEIKYLQKLEKLVSHKPKLSNLIKETITKTNRNHAAKTQQFPQEAEQNKNTELITNGLIFQSLAQDIYNQKNEPFPSLPQSAQIQMRSRLNPAPLTNLDTFQNQVDDFIAPILSQYTKQTPLEHNSEQQYQTTSQNRAVIVINQSENIEHADLILPSQIQHHSRPHSKAGILTSSNGLADDGGTSGGIGPSYYNQINGEEIRIGTEEDTNYLKFIVNEMKPNYHMEGTDFKHIVIQTNDTANSPTPQALDYQMIAEKGANLSPDGVNTLEGEIIQPVPSDSSPVNRSVRKGVIVNNNDHLTGPSINFPLQNDKIVMLDGINDDIDLRGEINAEASINKDYFRESLQQPRSKSQGMKYRTVGGIQVKKEISPPEKARNASGRSSRSKGKRKSLQSSLNSSYGIVPAQVDGVELRSIKIKQSTLQSRKLGSSISHHQDVDHLGEETVQDNQTTDIKNRRVMSENQSIASSSQYKTIKFKLMIMKSPQAQKQTALANLPSNKERDEINNRNVGGRQSAKNFRKDLKRHIMLEGMNGNSPPLNQKTHQSTMNVDQVAIKAKRTAESVLGTHHQRRTQKGKSFIGIKGDKINMVQNVPPLGSTINQQYSEMLKGTNYSVSNNNLHNADSQKPYLIPPQCISGVGEKMSQETFLHSSAVPLPTNMNSIYQGRQIAGSIKSNQSPDKHVTTGVVKESINEKSRYDNKQDEDEQMDANKGVVQEQQIMQAFNTDDEFEDVNAVQNVMQSRPPPQQHTQNVKSDAPNLDAFSFKSGGEIGGGLFSNITNQGEESESEQKNFLSSNIRKSAYLLMPKSNQSKRETTSRRTNRKSHQLNSDIHSMIIQGGSKTRHTRDHQKTPTAQTVQKGGARLVGSDDRETLIQPTVIPKVDNIKEAEDKHNDTISFESSVQSNKSVKGEEEMSPGDKTTKSNDGVHFEDLYLRNANYIMRYLDAPQPHQIEEASFGRGSSAIQQLEQKNFYPEETLMQTDVTSMMKATPLSGFMSPQPTIMSPKTKQHKSAKQKIAEIQLMNQKLKVRPSELGNQVLQGRPIKPLRQLIKENFEQFAIHNLSILEDKRVKRMTQHQQFFIDLQGSPKNSTHVVKKSPNIVEQDEDMRLQKYIWGTINQLQQEGYPIDPAMFHQHFIKSKTPQNQQELTSYAGQKSAAVNAFESKAFSNKRIKNAQKNQFVSGISSLENSEKGVATALATVETSERTTNFHEKNQTRAKRANQQIEYPNADLLQIKFKYQDKDIDQGGNSSVTLVVRQETGDLSMIGKTEEESTMNKGEEKNDTMTSHQLSQRGENSFIGPTAVNPIYAQEYPIDIQSTHPDQVQDKPEKALLKLPHQNLRIPVSDYYNTQRQDEKEKNDKKLPFDLHLMRINSPHLPSQLSPRLIQQQPHSKKHILEVQTSSNQQAQHSSRKLLNSMGSHITTGRVLQQTQPSPNFKPNVRIRNESNLRSSELSKNGSPIERNSKLLKSADKGAFLNNPVRESQGNESMARPSRESKIPKGIGEIVIKTYDRIKTSLESKSSPKDNHHVPGSIFSIKSPGLHHEVKDQTNIMHMRNRTQKLKTSHGGILSPQNFQKQYAAELNEFSGAEIVIKDLHTLRNKDMLKLPPSTDYFSPTNLPSYNDQRLLYSRATTTSNKQQSDKPQLIHGLHRRLLSNEVNNSLVKGTPTSIIQSVMSTPSSLDQRKPQIVIGKVEGRKTSFDYGILENTIMRRVNKKGPERCGSQFQRVRKGRVLEDNISGTKISNGIRIIT